MTQFDKSKGNSESQLTLSPQLIPLWKMKCFKHTRTHTHTPQNKLGIDSVFRNGLLKHAVSEFPSLSHYKRVATCAFIINLVGGKEKSIWPSPVCKTEVTCILKDHVILPSWGLESYLERDLSSYRPPRIWVRHQTNLFPTVPRVHTYTHTQGNLVDGMTLFS